jgi:predicted metal-dependent phosphoesterase TrpH
LIPAAVIIWKGLASKLLKADLHIHTEYSLDCGSPLEQIIARCLELGINCIAVCDHGTAEGAIKLKSLAPFRVIIAEELLTPHGEIMGMFLKETIPSRLSVEETISRIRAQDGLVCIPHPFDSFRPSALDSDILEEIVEQVDIIEVFNARILPFQSQTKAKIFAQKHALRQSAGSDAHTLSEIGNAYVEMPGFDGSNDFLKALSEGTVYGHRTNPLVHFYSLGSRLKKKFRQ